MEKQWVGLLDCNNFFVSCERLFRPDLANRPVVVLSSNDGCVVARSQEVKDIGIPMGVPYFKIKDIVQKHQITTFSSHFALYRDISRRVLAIMKDELEVVEQYSIDEAFFTTRSDPEMVAAQLKQVVEQQVGIPVSTGVAATKTRAKYASVLAKKSIGVKVLDESEWLSLAPLIPLSAIWGVGGKLELRYKQAGLQTVADMVAADPSRIDALFGIAGLRLQQELLGKPAVFGRKKQATQQSIMHSRSFKAPVCKKAILADALAYHVRHAAADLRSQNLMARRMSVLIRASRHGDFVLRGGTREAVFTTPTSDTMVMLSTAERLLNKLYEPDVPYKKAGVVLGELVSAAHGAVGLFANYNDNKSGELMQVVDSLNQGTGGELLLLGSRLASDRWQPRLKSRSPAYTTHWSELATVKAK